MLFPADKTDEIIKYVLDNLRQEDIDEMKIEFGDDWKNTVLNLAVNSEIQIIVDDKKNILGLYGIKEIDKDNAEVCLLSTNNLVKSGFLFLKGAKRVVEEWNKKYSKLYNFVYKKNKQALKWLKWLGFTIVEADSQRFYFYKVAK